jgi:O-antigen/teichoic acid export membrane protein
MVKHLLDKFALLKNTTLQRGVLFAFFAFCNNGISFVLLLILAKYIPPDGYGQLNLFNTFTQLYGYIVCLSTVGYLEVAFFKKSSAEFRVFIIAVVIIASTVLAVSSLLLLLFSSTSSRIIGLDVRYQWIALLICFFQVFNSINLEIWRLEEKPIKYGIYSVSIALLNFVLSLVLVVSLDSGWEGRLYAQFIVYIVFFFVSLLFLYFIKYLVLVLPRLSVYKELLNFGLPLLPHQIAYWMRQGLDRFVINYFHSVSYVGLYGFAFNFGNILTIIGGAFNASISVTIYKKLAQGYNNNKDSLRKLTITMLIVYFLLFLFIFFGSLLFIPMAMPNYKESIPYLLPLCLTALFLCYYMLYVNYLFYYSKTKSLMYITTSLSIVQFALSFTFTRFGVLWAAYISAFISFCIFALVFIKSKRVLKEVEINEVGIK